EVDRVAVGVGDHSVALSPERVPGFVDDSGHGIASPVAAPGELGECCIDRLGGGAVEGQGHLVSAGRAGPCGIDAEDYRLGVEEDPEGNAVCGASGPPSASSRPRAE